MCLRLDCSPDLLFQTIFQNIKTDLVGSYSNVFSVTLTLAIFYSKVRLGRKFIAQETYELKTHLSLQKCVKIHVWQSGM
jgi:hypothetical protein